MQAVAGSIPARHAEDIDMTSEAALSHMSNIAASLKALGADDSYVVLGVGHEASVNLLRGLGAEMFVSHQDDGSVIESATMPRDGRMFYAQHNLDPATAPPATVVF